MISKFVRAASAAAFVMGAPAAAAGGKPDTSSAVQMQQVGEESIPKCARKLGAIAIVMPEADGWSMLGLGTPEAVLKMFVKKSGCFSIVNRDGAMQKRVLERDLADAGELRDGSNFDRGQIRAADYFLQPDIVTSNGDSAGASAHVGFMGFGGGASMKKVEAQVTLSVVNAHSTEEEAMVEGYARKTDKSFDVSGMFAGISGGGGTYQNTAVGQVVVLAYLDAYRKLVAELGGLTPPTSAGAH